MAIRNMDVSETFDIIRKSVCHTIGYLKAYDAYLKKKIVMDENYPLSELN